MGQRVVQRRFGRGAAAAIIGTAMIAPGARAAPQAERLPDSQRPLSALASPARSSDHRGPADAGAMGGAARTGLSLGAVLALILGIAWVVRRTSRNGGWLMSAAGAARAPAGILEVLGRYPLSRATTLVLLRVDRRVILLSQSAGGVRGPASVSTLCEIASPDEVASVLAKARDGLGESVSSRFNAAMATAERAVAPALARPAPEEPGRVAAPVARRREVVTAAGDRAELWDVPARKRPTPASTAVPASATAKIAPAARPHADPFESNDAMIDTAAETLRRRLVAIRPASEAADGGGP